MQKNINKNIVGNRLGATYEKPNTAENPFWCSYAITFWTKSDWVFSVIVRLIHERKAGCILSWNTHKSYNLLYLCMEWSTKNVWHEVFV